MSRSLSRRRSPACCRARARCSQRRRTRTPTRSTRSFFSRRSSAATSPLTRGTRSAMAWSDTSGRCSQRSGSSCWARDSRSIRVCRRSSPSPELENMALSYAVLGISVVFEGVSWARALTQVRGRARAAGADTLAHIRNVDDPTLKTVVFEDSAALVGLAVAAIGDHAAPPHRSVVLGRRSLDRHRVASHRRGVAAGP